MSTQNPGLSRFASWLRDYITNNQTTALELATAADVSASTLFRILREKNRKPACTTIIKLSRVTGVQQNTLLELAELPAFSEEAALNPRRLQVLELFDAMSPSMQRAYIVLGESMLDQTRKAMQ